VHIATHHIAMGDLSVGQSLSVGYIIMLSDWRLVHANQQVIY